MRSDWIVVTSMLCAAAGCGADEPIAAAERHEEERAAPLRSDDELPEVVEVPSAAWPDEVRSLHDALDAFESIDACRARLRARTPTAVAEGLADLGYDGFFDDLCRGLAAVKAGSEEECDAIEISTARNGCRRRLAIVHARPSACPEDRVIPGREAVCVAWAARDASLCRAAREETRCRAVLAGDERACRRLRRGDRERCRAEVRRYATALGSERADSPAARAPSAMSLEVRAEGGEPITIDREVLARGVRLVPRGCAYAVALADPLGEPSVPVGLHDEAPSFHLRLTIPVGRERPIELAIGPSEAVLAVSTPDAATTSITGAEGQVRVERFEPRLGGALAGTIEGRLRSGTEQLNVQGRFASFVRDLDPLPDVCGERTGASAGGDR